MHNKYITRFLLAVILVTSSQCAKQYKVLIPKNFTSSRFDDTVKTNSIISLEFDNETSIAHFELSFSDSNRLFANTIMVTDLKVNLTNLKKDSETGKYIVETSDVNLFIQGEFPEIPGIDINPFNEAGDYNFTWTLSLSRNVSKIEDFVSTDYAFDIWVKGLQKTKIQLTYTTQRGSILDMTSKYSVYIEPAMFLVSAILSILMALYLLIKVEDGRRVPCFTLFVISSNCVFYTFVADVTISKDSYWDILYLYTLFAIILFCSLIKVRRARRVDKKDYSVENSFMIFYAIWYILDIFVHQFFVYTLILTPILFTVESMLHSRNRTTAAITLGLIFLQSTNFCYCYFYPYNSAMIYVSLNILETVLLFGLVFTFLVGFLGLVPHVDMSDDWKHMQIVHDDSDIDIESESGTGALAEIDDGGSYGEAKDGPTKEIDMNSLADTALSSQLLGRL